MSEGRFDFLKDLVVTVPDVQGEEDLAETPTPTPRSSASNQQFVYPTTSGSSAQRHSFSGTTASSALGAPPQELEEIKQEQHVEQNPPIAGIK